MSEGVTAGLADTEVEAEYLAGTERRRRALRDRRLRALTIGGVARRRPLMTRAEGIYGALRAGLPLREIARQVRRLADDVDAAEAERLRRHVEAVEANWWGRR